MKQKTVRFLISILALLLVGGATVGCGSDDDTKNNGDSESVANNTTDDVGTTAADAGMTDDAGTMTSADGGMLDDAGVNEDAGGTDANDGDAGPGEAPPFEPKIRVSYSATQMGSTIVSDDRQYDGDEVGSVSCEFDELGMRLLMLASAPDCGNDEFRVLLPGFNGPGTYTSQPGQTTQYGTWTAYSPPRLRAQGQRGCFDRPILPRSQEITVTADDWGRLTLEAVQTGSSVSPNVSAGNYDTRTEFTLEFDPGACDPYDSGTPACSGATGEDLGEGAETVYKTACANVIPGPTCDDTAGCSTNLTECREPTNEECQGVIANFEGSETEREDRCNQVSRCEFVPAAAGDPSRCDARPVSEDASEQCIRNDDFTSCRNDSCVPAAQCEGSASVDCSELPDDDLVCRITYPCVP